MKNPHMSYTARNWTSTAAIARVASVSLLFMAFLISTGRCGEGQTIAFDLPHFDDLLIVPVTISDEEHLFVLDSGASVNVFHTDLQDCLGEQIGERRANPNTNDEVKTRAFRAPVAHVGSLPVTRDAPVACMDLSNMRSAMGRDIQGILGMPFFATNIIQVNFDQRKLRLLPQSTEPSEEWGQPVDVFYTDSNRPVVRARFGDYANEPCVVDTGFSGTLSLRPKVFTYLSQLQQITPRADTAVATISRVNKKTSKGMLSEFELASFSHHDLLVLKKDEGMSLIGLNYFRRYLVTFDLSRGRIYLARGFDFDRPDENIVIGVGILRRDGKTIVEVISSDGLAEEAGMRVGDELVSVGGKEIESKPLAEILWLFRTKMMSENRLEIGILRKGRVEHLVIRAEPNE